MKNIIAVGAGKGGVGKTTVSVNLALALAQMGARVGILDGDVYGPNVPLMFGLTAELGTDGQKIAPAEKFGVQIVSMAFLAKDDQALIWRGPMLHSAIQQFFTRRGVEGPRLPDHRHAAGHRRRRAVAQPDGEGGRRRGGHHAADRLAGRHPPRREDVREAQHPHARARGEHELLRLPELPHRERHLRPRRRRAAGHRDGACRSWAGCRCITPIRVGGDRGVPLVVAEPGSPAGRGFIQLAERVAMRAAVAAHENAIKHKGKIPLIQVR